MALVATLYKDDVAYAIDNTGEKRFRPENVVTGYPKTVVAESLWEFGDGAPTNHTGPGQFSLILEGYIRWNASVVYNFRFRKVDGVRFYLSGVLLVDDWNETTIGTPLPLPGDWNATSGDVELDYSTSSRTAGNKEKIRIEYYSYLAATADIGFLAIGIKKAADASYAYLDDSSDVTVTTS